MVSLEKCIYAWNAFVSGKDSDIDESAFTGISDSEIDEFLTGDVRFAKGLAEAKDFFSDEDFNRLKSLSRSCFDGGFCNKLLDFSANGERIRLGSINSDGVSLSSFGVLDPLNNFIRFKDGDETFFLCQRMKVFSGIYFPKRKILVSFSFPLKAVFDLNRQIVRNFSSGARIGVASAVTGIYGVVVDFNRPYHYFYDILPFFDDFMILDRSAYPKVVYFDSHFLDVAEFYEGKIVSEQWDRCRLNKYLFETDSCCVVPGYPPQKTNRHCPEELRDLDLRIVNYARIKHAGSLDDILACDFKIWFGFSGEKRKWLEQFEALKKILSFLVGRHENIVVFADGLTGCVGVDNSKLIENSSYELDIISKLEVEFVNVRFINLIGALADRKIAYASCVDFFISDFLTDSMWAARFGRKPGIGYGSSAALEMLKKREDHVHTNTTLVPREMVTDIKFLPLDNWSRLNINIDPDRFFELFMSFYERVLDQKTGRAAA